MNEVLYFSLLFSFLSKSLTDAAEYKSSPHPHASLHQPCSGFSTSRSRQVSKGSLARNKVDQVSIPAAAREHCSSAAAQPFNSSRICSSAATISHCTSPLTSLFERQSTQPPLSRHTAACLRGHTSRPRTLGATTKTSRAQGPRTKQSHSDVVNYSVNAGLREPIAQSLLKLITLIKNMPISPTTQPQLDHSILLPATQQRISPVCHDPLPWQPAVRPYKSTQAIKPYE